MQSYEVDAKRTQLEGLVELLQGQIDNATDQLGKLGGDGGGNGGEGSGEEAPVVTPPEGG